MLLIKLYLLKNYDAQFNVFNTGGGAAAVRVLELVNLRRFDHEQRTLRSGSEAFVCGGTRKKTELTVTPIYFVATHAECDEFAD